MKPTILSKQDFPRRRPTPSNRLRVARQHLAFRDDGHCRVLPPSRRRIGENVARGAEPQTPDSSSLDGAVELDFAPVHPRGARTIPNEDR